MRAWRCELRPQSEWHSGNGFALGTWQLAPDGMQRPVCDSCAGNIVRMYACMLLSHHFAAFRDGTADVRHLLSDLSYSVVLPKWFDHPGDDPRYADETAYHEVIWFCGAKTYPPFDVEHDQDWWFVYDHLDCKHHGNLEGMRDRLIPEVREALKWGPPFCWGCRCFVRPIPPLLAEVEGWKRTSNNLHRLKEAVRFDPDLGTLKRLWVDPETNQVTRWHTDALPGEDLWPEYPPVLSSQV